MEKIIWRIHNTTLVVIFLSQSKAIRDVHYISYFCDSF